MDDMAWDSSRTVNWKRLLREWLVYVGVMAVIFAVFLRDKVTVGSVVGLVASLPMYLLFGWVLAKIGYQRQTYRALREQTLARKKAPPSAPERRSPPAATRRTSTGPSSRRPTNKPKKR